MKHLITNKYGLNSRIKLKEVEENHIAIVKKIKSRIIMKDGLKILEQAKQIKSFDKELQISLIISGPICSKTVQLLNNQHINIIKE